MDSHVEHVLEFAAVKEIVSGYAASSLGREAVRELHPVGDLAQLEQEFALVRELMTLLSMGDAPPIGALRDPRVLLQSLHPENAMLEPRELLELAQFLDVVNRARQFFARKRAAAPNCYVRFNRLEWVGDLQNAIEEKINEKAELRDNASQVLQTVRREIRSTEEKIHRQIQEMIQGLEGESILQDNYFTVRNNRYVLPVRTGSRGKIRGIVQDASNSGETLFIEPFELVEITNQLAELHLAEKEEMRKILLSLSNKVRQHLNALNTDVELMQELDNLHARARFGFERKLSIPNVSAEGSLALRKAHHALLYLRSPERSIALDIVMRTADRALVISGPNAGGKTTALKNIGLNVLMVQSAIPVPCAPESRFPVYQDVFADIGDEQNVTEGISTFSSHMRNIVQVFLRLRENALVLLDELGAATDPSQGGALATAILEELARRDATTFATSHLRALKQWAHSFPGARNASFRLDEQTHRPSFMLTMDIPGISEAFIIAVAEGIPSSIIERAREQTGAGEENLNALIISLQEKEKTLEEKLSSAQRLEQDAEVHRMRYQELYEAVAKEKRTLRRQMLEEKENLLAEAKRLVEQKIAHLPSKEEMLRARKELEQIIQEAREQEAALADEPIAEWKLNALRPGQKVSIADMHEEGILGEVDRAKKTARVSLSGMEIDVPLHKIEIIEEQSADVASQYPSIKYPTKPDVPHTLDLHGLRVAEALERIDKYLDDAVLADYSSVKLVHGYGTGMLRQGIHEFLKHHYHVKAFRIGITEEGGDAVTIVDLK